MGERLALSRLPPFCCENALSIELGLRELYPGNLLTWLLQPLSYVLLTARWASENLKSLSPVPVLVVQGLSGSFLATWFLKNWPNRKHSGSYRMGCMAMCSGGAWVQVSQ
ncbi:MAG: hypothetical protein H6937_06050 [Burkholderiales bacterium]|nr:hypothetical protein [Burkholderiales bacterium]MDR4517429.1 hypothetical protein [Nitrosomonas sp.]